MGKYISPLLALAVAFVAAPASAATVLPDCSSSDISATAPPTITEFGAFSCRGFFEGNLLNSAHVDEQVTALNELLGVNAYSAATFDFDSFLKLDGLSGSQTIDFPGVLNGMVLFAVHYGAGNGSPSDVAGNVRNDKSDSTAFYRFDSGANLDKFYLNFGASSNAVLYSSGNPTSEPPPVVPEPATWMMMFMGIGAIGATLRLRSRKSALQFT